MSAAAVVTADVVNKKLTAPTNTVYIIEIKAKIPLTITIKDITDRKHILTFTTTVYAMPKINAIRTAYMQNLVRQPYELIMIYSEK